MTKLTKAVISNSFRKGKLREWELSEKSVVISESQTDEFIRASSICFEKFFKDKQRTRAALHDLMDDLLDGASFMFCGSKVLRSRGKLSAEDSDEINLHLLGIFGIVKGYTEKAEHVRCADKDKTARSPFHPRAVPDSSKAR